MAHNPPGGRPGQCCKAYEANQPAQCPHSNGSRPRPTHPDYAHLDYVSQPPGYGPPPTYGYAPPQGCGIPPAYGCGPPPGFAPKPPHGDHMSSYPPRVDPAPYRQLGYSEPRNGTRRHATPNMGPEDENTFVMQGVPQAVGYGPPLQPDGTYGFGCVPGAGGRLDDVTSACAPLQTQGCAVTPAQDKNFTGSTSCQFKFI
ncbi:hypothetical protein LSAT2_025502 [Lamellibrachia satsuma]|nr:hypothetical protein LSAT2_025502 [Lamellibrachia satsuma]